MPAFVTFIHVTGTAIDDVRKIIGRAPAAPDRHVITDAAQLGLLERLGPRLLKWNGAAIVTKTRMELDADAVAVATARSANESRAVDSRVFRHLVNARLAPLGQPEITEAEETTQRTTIRNGGA